MGHQSLSHVTEIIPVSLLDRTAVLSHIAFGTA